MTIKYQEELSLAVQAARKAGRLINNKLYRHQVTETKSCLSDLVTEVDREAESCIVQLLKQHFPGHAIIGEEQQGNCTGEPGGNMTWYVDPLDGTTNFVFGVPFCAVSIALAEDGVPVLGVVHDPLREETFTALQGGGARLNGSTINVDKTIATLEHSLLVTGYPGNIANRPRMHQVNYTQVLDCCNNLRALGSAALELAYVAGGRLTGFWEVALRPWDVAAGMVLVQEADGTVSNLAGQPLQLAEDVDIVATNGLIHQELLTCLTG